MNKKIRWGFLLPVLFIQFSCETKCDDCFVSTLVYDSTRVHDFEHERGSHLLINEVYTHNSSFGNLGPATVYVATRFSTGDAVLIISPYNREKVAKGFHIMLNPIEDVKVGDSLKIQLSNLYLKFVRDTPRIRFAYAFMPEI